jgi:segregation and condensation protein B
MGTHRVGIGPAIARRNRWLRQSFAPGRSIVRHDDPWVRDTRLARLEAILFLAREPLSTRKLAQLAGLADGTEARTLIRRLNRLYDGGGSPFRAEEVAGGFQLLSRVGFGSWLRRLYPSPAESRLSGPALETLAIVAYRQPVLKAEIDGLRGVDCGEIVRQLMDRDLVRMIGRARDLGRPYLYGTTKRFLRVFGLRSLDDLPRAAELRGRASDSNHVPTA